MAHICGFELFYILEMDTLPLVSKAITPEVFYNFMDFVLYCNHRKKVAIFQ